MDRRLKVNFAPFSNFGDTINPWMLHKNNIPFIFTHHTKNNKIVMAGSIISSGPKEDDLIWGSGLIDSSRRVEPGSILLAVRGPLTFENAKKNGCKVENTVLGDPGLLLSRMYKPNIEKKYKLGIIPHMMDFSYYKNYIEQNREKFQNTTLIDPNTKCSQIDNFINKVLECEKIVSTCLHGIVCADSYNIPVVWSKIGNRLMGDDFKFLDYHYSIGIDSIPKVEFVENENIDIESREIKLNLDDLWNVRPWDIADDQYYVDIDNDNWTSICYPDNYKFEGTDKLWDDSDFKLT